MHSVCVLARKVDVVLIFPDSAFTLLIAECVPECRAALSAGVFLPWIPVETDFFEMHNDSQLQRDVLAELNWEPSVTAAHIGVTAKDGVVTLTGHVDNFWSKHEAERAARRVQGVRAVAEEIEVQLPFDRRRGDDDIAAAIVERLSWNVSIPAKAVKVTVEKGFVTLSGELDWHYQKDIVETEVRNLSGVLGVTNRIELKRRVNTTDIRTDIVSALKRSWYTRPDSITVKADGGAVTLSGIVHSPHARRVASATAWGASGTTSVVNNLTIT